MCAVSMHSPSRGSRRAGRTARRSARSASRASRPSRPSSPAAPRTGWRLEHLPSESRDLLLGILDALASARANVDHDALPARRDRPTRSTRPGCRPSAGASPASSEARLSRYAAWAKFGPIPASAHKRHEFLDLLVGVVRVLPAVRGAEKDLDALGAERLSAADAGRESARGRDVRTDRHGSAS